MIFWNKIFVYSIIIIALIFYAMCLYWLLRLVKLLLTAKCSSYPYSIYGSVTYSFRYLLFLITQRSNLNSVLMEIGRKLCYLRSYDGWEYTSSEFDKYFKKNRLWKNKSFAIEWYVPLVHFSSLTPNHLVIISCKFIYNNSSSFLFFPKWLKDKLRIYDFSWSYGFCSPFFFLVKEANN